VACLRSKCVSGVSIGRLSGVGALWDCVPLVCVGVGGCAGGGVPLEAVLVLPWCGEVSLLGKSSSSSSCVVVVKSPPPFHLSSARS